MNWQVMLLSESARLLVAGGALLLLTRRLLLPWLPNDPVDRSISTLLYLWLTLTMIPLALASLKVYEWVGFWLSLLSLSFLALHSGYRSFNPIAYLEFRSASLLRRTERARPQEPLGEPWENVVSLVPLSPSGPLPSPPLTPARSSEDPSFATPLSPAAPFIPRWRPWTWIDRGLGEREARRLAILGGLVVVAVAGYLRATDLWLHPGLPFGDAPVHLKWARELELNDLFKDGVYPLGMHAIISSLNVLLAVDLPTLYRLWGPLSTVLWVGTTIWAGARLSGSRWAGILAGALVGWVGTDVWWDLRRQAATLPQETGYLWLLPALIWAHQYLERGDRRAALPAAAAVAVTAAGHWGNLAFLLLALGAMGLASLRTAPSGRILRLGLLSLGAALAGEGPMLIGFLSHPVGGNNLAYAASASAIQPVPFEIWAMLGAGTGLAIVSGRPGWSEWRGRTRWALAVLLTWLAAWQSARLSLNSGQWAIIIGAFTQRGRDYATMAAVLVAVLGYGMAEQALERLLRDRFTRFTAPTGSAGSIGLVSSPGSFAGAVLLVGALAVVPPPVIGPGPQFVTDDMVMAVHDLARGREPLQWVTVGNRGLLSLSLGRSFQIDDYRFIDTRAGFPAGPDGLKKTVEKLVGTSRIEVLAFVPVAPSPPRVPAGSILDPEEKQVVENERGAWALSGLIAELVSGSFPPEVVWKGSELVVYRIWSGRTPEDVRPASGGAGGG